MSFLFVPTPQLVAKEDALPGRAEPILEPKPHAVLGTPITGPWKEGQRSLLVALGFSVDSRGSATILTFSLDGYPIHSQESYSIGA